MEEIKTRDYVQLGDDFPDEGTAYYEMLQGRTVRQVVNKQNEHTGMNFGEVIDMKTDGSLVVRVTRRRPNNPTGYTETVSPEEVRKIRPSLVPFTEEGVSEEVHRTARVWA